MKTKLISLTHCLCEEAREAILEEEEEEEKEEEEEEEETKTARDQPPETGEEEEEEEEEGEGEKRQRDAAETKTSSQRQPGLKGHSVDCVRSNMAARHATLGFGKQNFCLVTKERQRTSLTVIGWQQWKPAQPL
ncbi:unnamed protein product [Pleuronectes platessa]|uniref:Uncharacterized protein n=1 Tax=Pleuronectes platessa TaxID=8262 RepID=A0A9N7V6G5_PLEPL|nr:unnamed protein product [Pleuronectes platessa]